MMALIRLTLASLLPVAVCILFERLRKQAWFQRLPNAFRQLIIGCAFGLVAVCATLLGVDADGAVINVRDAAPICAGLLFGAPSAIVAGAVGGLHRWLWAAGEYTRLACSLATVAAGLWAAGIRKWMFDDKRPKWYYGFAVGVVVEILHMLMIILTHMTDIHAAFAFVRVCTLPMIALNALAVMVAAGGLSLGSREKRGRRRGPKKIANSFGRWLLAVVLVAFGITTAFSWSVETRLSVSDAEALLTLNIRDVRKDIMDASDANLLSVTRSIAGEIDQAPIVSRATLERLRKKYDVSEINLVGPNGVIIASTYDDFRDYDMYSGEQSAEFTVLLSGEKQELVQRYQPTSYDSSIMRKYAGVTLGRGGFVQVAYDAQRFQRDIDSRVVGATRNRHIGDSGSIIIADENGVIVSDPRASAGQTLAQAGVRLNGVAPGVRFSCPVYGEASYCIYAETEGYVIVAVLPQSEVLLSRDVSLYLTVFMEAVIFAALYVLIYHLIKTRIVDNIQRINASLAEITGGDLDVVVDVRSNEEFASLSDDINATVVTLKRYIAEAAARIDQELEFARAVQHSALPGFFPERSELDLYAQMFTAKEVGGDFYDFYFLDHDHMAFLVADVSGKGIPAAMFMMTAKTLLKGFAEAGREVQEIFSLTNEKLCLGNEANMFVTAWMGLIDLRTGEVEYANAGHNPPLIRRGDGNYEFLRSRPGFVLGGMEGMKYQKQTVSLQSGDMLLLYTDGVTEANDASGRLYGEDRLISLLNRTEKDVSARELCETVKRDVDGFVGKAAQFDDLTMLALRYCGEDGFVKEITLDATVENIAEVTAFVQECLRPLNLPMKAKTQCNIAVDEVFGNIAQYAYQPGLGKATVRVALSNDPPSVILTFIDQGKPFDPLKCAQPDTGLVLEERAEGGLGVFMVRKMMDDMQYEFRDGKNILHVRKNI